MVTIKKIIDYTIPLCGNKRIMPYGKLLVSDGEISKVVSIQGEPKQFFTFTRKRYYIKNAGSLYAPKYEIAGGNH